VAGALVLLVGLGNPGPEHARQRHNVGFMAADAIARRHGFGPFRARFHGEIAEGSVAGRRVLLLKPMTYMNDSGRAVLAAATFHKVRPADVVVLHDELDLAPGKVRAKTGGGHAGHNGLRSLHEAIGPGFRRLRLGIGHPGDKARVLGHVLGNFAAAEKAWLDPMLEAVAEHLALLLDGEEAAFMSKVSLAVTPPRPKAARIGGKAGGEKKDKKEG
jgi:PTH1 family peptidyl-tRNA hydrolase